MKIAIFSVKEYEKPFFEAANTLFQYDLIFIESRLTLQTAKLAIGYSVICCFVNDQVDAAVLELLAVNGVRLIALRSAGFNHVDLETAKRLNIVVATVPAYSPNAVAEFAVGLILALNRKIHRAYNRIRKHDFSLHGLLGFDLNGHTVGVIGTGRIGSIFASIMQAFGRKIVAFDPKPNEQYQQTGIRYVSLTELDQQADIINLHRPLTSSTYHMINQEALAQMKSGVMLINTSRGALMDTKAVTDSLKICYLGIDVYEGEEALFFQDLSETIIQDDTFTRLQSFPNVIITGHQAFFTKEALTNIAETTLANVTAFITGVGNLYKI